MVKIYFETNFIVSGYEQIFLKHLIIFLLVHHNNKKITALHKATRCQLMHQFINMNSFSKIHQDLQSKRISRALNDVQVIMSLLKETMINPVEKSLMSMSIGTSSTDKIKDSPW